MKYSNTTKPTIRDIEVPFRSEINTATSTLGHKWTVEIVYVLSISPLRFCQLQRAAGGINPRTLSARLDYLENQNIVSRQPMEGCAGDQYQLEQKGKDLLPAIEAMTSWGKKYFG